MHSKETAGLPQPLPVRPPALTLIHNRLIAERIRSTYSQEDVAALWHCLQEHDTLAFKALPNGLFPAAALEAEHAFTGYSHVWVRDNVFVAYSHYFNGDRETAVHVARTLMTYFIKHQNRFTDIVAGRADPANPMNRPHVRFDGSKLGEIPEKWAHAQNDALGYFVWLFCKLADNHLLAPTLGELRMLALFPQYFRAIAYWQDEDSGHWEEIRKVSASSIGVVTAGLKELMRLLQNPGLRRQLSEAGGNEELVAELISKGEAALKQILPAECIQPDPAKARRYDAALLFLVYPLQIVEAPMSDTIVQEVAARLRGEIGIRRYPGDSYWAPDYKSKLSPAQRTADFSDDLFLRDKLLPAEGLEAQWCLFDAIISCYYGNRFQSTGSPEDLRKHTEYLNRALGQITSSEQNLVPPFKCPELYYLENNQYVPNDHVPLLWAQANLLLALRMLSNSLKLDRPIPR